MVTPSRPRFTRLGRATVLAVVVLVAISCGRPVTPPPMSVDIAPVAVAPGEPLQVTLRTTADVVTITLVDAQGVVLANWQGPCQGSTIVWLQPQQPSVRGDLSLIVARPTAGRGFVATMPVPLDVVRPIIFAAAVDGLYSIEKTADGGFRWTTGNARLEVEDPGGNAIVHLRYRCGREVARTAAVRIGGGPSHDLVCGDARTTVAHIPIRHEDWHGQVLAAMAIEVRPTFVPAVVLGTEDRRELGLEFEYAIVTLAGNGR